ncbi:MAG: glycosyltransferase family 39 protein [Candidatus Omnitrophota bacterium]
MIKPLTSDFFKRDKTSIITGVVIAFLISFLPLEATSPFVIICLGLSIGMFLIFLNSDYKNFNFLLTLFIVAFLLRILVSLCLYNLVFLYKGTGGLLGDGWAYSENGYEIVKMWKAGITNVSIVTKNMLKISNTGTLGNHDFYNARIYSFTGKSPLSLVFINCLAGSLVAIMTYKMTEQLSNRKAAMLAAILTSFWPSTFLWSIQNYKEPIVVFLICFLMWIALNLTRRFRFYLLFSIIGLMVVLKEFREIALFAILVSLLFSILFSLSIRKEMYFLIIFIGLIVAFFYLQKFKSSLPKIFEYESLLEWMQRMRSYRSYGNLAFLADWDITSIPIFIIFLPIALIAAWLAPFPWQLGSFSQIIAMPEMIIFYCCIPSMIYGIRFILKNRFKQGAFIIIYISITSAILALIDSNIGTLFRHRAMILPFCFIFIAIGLDKYNFRITAHE